MRQHAGQSALELLGVGANGVAAAFSVRKGDDPINIGGQLVPGEAVRDQFSGVRRAVAGRHYGNIVARADPAILAWISKEGRARLAGSQRNLRGWIFVIEVELFKSQIVRVHVAARLDDRRGAADDLAVASHG